MEDLRNVKYMLSLGMVVMTPGARLNVNSEDMLKALERHRALDFGDISEPDKETNLDALKNRG